MKTNIGIELTDEQRNRLACLLAGKETKALATRAQVTELVEGFVAGLLDQEPGAPGSAQETREPWEAATPRAQPAVASPTARVKPRGRYRPGWPRVTPEIIAAAAARGIERGSAAFPGYVNGWYMLPSPGRS